jgi:hypothetical protein
MLQDRRVCIGLPREIDCTRKHRLDGRPHVRAPREQDHGPRARASRNRRNSSSRRSRQCQVDDQAIETLCGQILEQLFGAFYATTTRAPLRSSNSCSAARSCGIGIHDTQRGTWRLVAFARRTRPILGASARIASPDKCVRGCSDGSGVRALCGEHHAH